MFSRSRKTGASTYLLEKEHAWFAEVTLNAPAGTKDNAAGAFIPAINTKSKFAYIIAKAPTARQKEVLYGGITAKIPARVKKGLLRIYPLPKHVHTL